MADNSELIKALLAGVAQPQPSADNPPATFATRQGQKPRPDIVKALTEWGSASMAQQQPNWFGQNILANPDLAGALFAANFAGPGAKPNFVRAYHGTTADLSKGIRPMARDNLDATSPPAISLSPTGERANAFAQNGVGGYPSGSAVHMRDLDIGGFKEIDWPNFKKEYAGVPEDQLGWTRRGKDTFVSWDPYTWKALLEQLQKEGHPGAVVNGMADASGTGPQYVTLDAGRLSAPAPTPTHAPSFEIGPGGNWVVRSGAGVLEARPSPDAQTVNILGVRVPQAQRGQGIGTSMYQRMIDEAHAKGFTVQSDPSVSPSAQRVYDALQRRGYEVQRNPKAVSDRPGDSLYDPAFEDSVYTIPPKR